MLKSLFSGAAKDKKKNKDADLITLIRDLLALDSKDQTIAEQIHTAPARILPRLDKFLAAGGIDTLKDSAASLHQTLVNTHKSTTIMFLASTLGPAKIEEFLQSGFIHKFIHDKSDPKKALADAIAMKAIMAEISEDEFVTAVMVGYDLLPPRTRALAAALKGQEPTENAVREQYRNYSQKTAQEIAEQNLHIVQNLPLDLYDKAVKQIKKKAGSTKALTTCLKHITDNVSSEQLQEMSTGGFLVIHDILTQAAGGKLFSVSDTARAKTCGQNIKHTLATIEDAFVKANLLPDIDLVQAFRDSTQATAVNDNAAPAKKAPAPRVG